MARLYIFLLLIAFWFFSGWACLGQVVEVTKDNTPLISHGDSLFTMQEMWVQSFQSELKQRRKLLSAERRNKWLRKKLHTKKKDVLQTIDTLVIEVEMLTYQRDSLQNVITTGLQGVSRDALRQIHTLNKTINEKRSKIQAMSAIVTKLNKWIVRLVIITGSETLLIILLLI